MLNNCFLKKYFSSMDTNFVNEEDIIYEEDLNMEVTLFHDFICIIIK